MSLRILMMYCLSAASLLRPAQIFSQQTKAATPGSVSARPAENDGRTARMPVYVLPYYNSNGSTGPIINVGKFSRKLTVADRKSIEAVVRQMKREWPALSVVQMYVAAIRLFDLGHKDKAVYWFYSAQYRARLLMMVSAPRKSDGNTADGPGGRFPGHHAFFTLAGRPINYYAYRRPRMLAGTIQRVAKEHRTLPPLRTIYPTVPFIPD